MTSWDGYTSGERNKINHTYNLHIIINAVGKDEVGRAYQRCGVGAVTTNQVAGSFPSLKDNGRWVPRGRILQVEGTASVGSGKGPALSQE